MMSDETLKSLYQRLAVLTEPVCAKCDRGPTRCCDFKLGCELAAKFAFLRYDVELKEVNFDDQYHDGRGRLPYLGPNGCTVEPYLRPHCARFVCCESCMNQETRLKRALLMQQIKEVEEREGGIRVEEAAYY